MTLRRLGALGQAIPVPASELVRRSVRQTGPANVARWRSSDTGHKDFATGRRNLAEEAGNEGVAQLDSLVGVVPHLLWTW